MEQLPVLESNEKNPELWKLAQNRADFKRHLLIYIIMNIFFWAIWVFTGKNHSYEYNYNQNFPWPVWSMFGWGIGLFFHFMAAYVYPKNSVEREYQKLKDKNLQ